MRSSPFSSNTEAVYVKNGKRTEIFAPGLSIQSTWISFKYAVTTISGTSMTSSHIACLVAYDLSPQTADESESPNLLASNSAGCVNHSQIVEAGGYEAKAKAQKQIKLP
ncbi:cerevisin [Trichoderma gamsii]|uniref:Cerevisin n=1 Tax=Trichoderma gamsii TaxID=398673 RepID=A0A2P4ZXQ0_9HYPO|nr:cerevisin [Trichoderma gamsii]PON29072.1 cerevisin [Trichoderma gamsii]